jgi:hypothetical protein
MMRLPDKTSKENIGNESTLITLADGSTMPNRAHLAAEVPPIKDFGKKIEAGKAEYKAKHGDKLPKVF